MVNPSSFLLVTVLVIGSCRPSLCLKEITGDVLPYITQVPCKNADGNCSLDSFIKENTNSTTFIKTWMLALYFDIERPSSRDVVSEVLPSLHKRLYNHQIVFGRVRCGEGTKRQAVIASFCENMDPSIIYAYLGGKKTEFWWSVSDFLSHRFFVLGNLLTLQYKWRLDMYTPENCKDKMAELWSRKLPERKHLMVVHVASASLEVNTTDGQFNKDRVRAFDYLGQVIRNIPGVTVAVATGTIDTGVQFWYYDNQNCPDINDTKKCWIQKMGMWEWDGYSTDDLLCMLERYSFGLKAHKNLAHLGQQRGVSGVEENERRLVKVCSFVMFVYDDEPSEDFQSVGNDVAKSMYYINNLVFMARRDYARDLLDSFGGSQYLGKDNIVMKYHTDTSNVSPSEYHLANLSTPGGMSVIIKPYVGIQESSEVIRAVKMDMKKYFVYDSFEDDEPDFNPYLETDELFLLWSNQKAITSDFFVKLNHTTFLEMTRVDAKAVVLFFQPWNSASVYSRDLVFPAAANYLQSEFGVADRLYSVNCFDYNELCHEQKITRYPVVKAFHGTDVSIFPDTISVRNVVREALRLGQSIFYPKSGDEVEKILNYTNNIVDHVIIAVDIEEETLKEVKRACSRLRGSEMVIVTQHDLLPPQLKKELSKGTVVSYSSRLTPRLVFHQMSSKESSVEQFVGDVRRNRVMELSWDRFKEISTSDRPLLVLFVHFMTTQLHCLLSGLASAHSGDLFVTWMNARKQHEYPIFRDFQSPELVIRHPVKAALYRHPINHLYSKDCGRADPVIEQWIQSVLSGQSSADEVLQERKYPPSGPYINILDDVYPKPGTSDPGEGEGETAASTSDPGEGETPDAASTATSDPGEGEKPDAASTATSDSGEATTEPANAPETPDVGAASPESLLTSDNSGSSPDATNEPHIITNVREEL